MRRLVPAVAVALAAVMAPQAQAAVPAPTVKVTTVNEVGVTLVKSKVDARWKVGQPGRYADLLVSSTNVPGTTTTIDALWTSKPVRVYGGITAVEYTAQMQRRGAPTGPASATYGVRFRTEGGTWSGWRDTTRPLPSYADEVVMGDGIKPTHDEKLRYQFQVRIRVVIGDTNQEVQHWVARANN